MSHSVRVTIVADQEINICGKEINIYTLRSLTLDRYGHVIGLERVLNKCVDDDPKRDSQENILNINGKRYNFTKRYITVCTDGTVLQSDTPEGWDAADIIEPCEYKMQDRLDKEEFNCIEDYFVETIGKRQKPHLGFSPNEYRCKLCGWEFFVHMLGAKLLVLTGDRTHEGVKGRMTEHLAIRHVKP